MNKGETTFSDEYREVAEKTQALLAYGPKDPFAYDYNGACTAFANGESAMYTIGSYAIPQIHTVNPDMDIDSFKEAVEGVDQWFVEELKNQGYDDGQELVDAFK